MDKQLTREQIAVVEQCENAGFNPDIAFTLTLDLGTGKNNEVRDYTSRKTRAEKVTAKWMNTYPSAQQPLYDELESMFKVLYEKLSKKCYGTNYKRLATKNPSKKLRAFGGIERSKNGMLHIHGAINLPQHINLNELEAWAVKVWSSFYIGSNQQYKFKSIYDVNGWIEYISKDFHKNDGMGYISESKLN